MRNACAPAAKLPRLEVLRILAPPILAAALFVVAFFGVLLPSAEKNLLGQKKAALATLTRVGRDILSYYEGQARDGKLSLEEAQRSAVRQIRALRYGPEGKDYFWINDLGPVMVMHPYRPDLEGHDLSAFSDRGGKRLFKEFVDVAGGNGAGYVEYLWQWQDDPSHIVPKLSYVELFKPWGWIIGTGVYLEDVREEIAALTRKAALISAAILIVILSLAGFIVRQGIREKSARLAAEEEVRKYQQHLEELADERTEQLQQAQANVRVLSGFLPICASCKKIRDDQGFWNQIEQYIREHSEAEFTHSICPDCATRLYPGIPAEKFS